VPPPGARGGGTGGCTATRRSSACCAASSVCEGVCVSAANGIIFVPTKRLLASRCTPDPLIFIFVEDTTLHRARAPRRQRQVPSSSTDSLTRA
jgi:hypothetical protein